MEFSQSSRELQEAVLFCGLPVLMFGFGILLVSGAHIRISGVLSPDKSGNNKPERIMDCFSTLEKALGITTRKESLPMHLMMYTRPTLMLTTS